MGRCQRDRTVDLGESLVRPVEPHERDGAAAHEVGVVGRQRERRAVACERLRVALERVLGEPEVGMRIGRVGIAREGGAEKPQRLRGLRAVTR